MLGAVYFFIAIATFKHTMWAGSMVFEGEYPVSGTDVEKFWWAASGFFVAVAIDVGMFTTAHILTQVQKAKQAAIFVAAFIVAALASLYTQLLYSSAHTSEFEYGVGMTQYWQDYLQPIVDARPILLAAFLPLFAIIYTTARISLHQEEVSTQREITTSTELQNILIEKEENNKALMVPAKEVTVSKRERKGLQSRNKTVVKEGIKLSGKIAQVSGKTRPGSLEQNGSLPYEGEVLSFTTNDVGSPANKS